ncbi:MAG: hypoxanthine-guanine phosphoribosyltransferase, partial [Pontibacterium sp.]
MQKPSLEDIKQAYIQADLLYSESEVNHAIRKMGIEISDALKDSNPIILCVMNGGLVTTGKLLTELNFPLEADYVHASRYRNTTYGQTLEWKVAPHIDLKGRAVLVIDDILDEGHTLAAIVEYCQAKGASETYMAVLVNKLHYR